MSGRAEYIVAQVEGSPVVMRRAAGGRTFIRYVTPSDGPSWVREDRAVEIAGGLNELERRRARDRREAARKRRERAA